MNLIAKLTADATAAERGIAAFSKKASGYVGSIGSELKSQLVGAFAASAVISAVRSFGAHVVETVDNIKDMSEQLGVSTDEIQRMQKAANDAGVKFTVISGALQRIDQLRAQAAGGDKAASGLFSGLGIDPNVGTSLDILQQAVKASFGTAQQQAAYADLFAKKANILRGVVGELNAQGPITLIAPGQIDEIDKANNRLKEIQRQATAQAAGPAAGVLRYIGGALGGLTEGSFASRIAGLFPAVMVSRGFRSMFGSETLPPMAADTFVGPVQAQAGPQSSSFAASTPAASAISLGQPGDSLSRIGLFVGGRPEVKSLASIERNTADAARSAGQQTRILKSIEDLLKISADQI